MPSIKDLKKRIGSTKNTQQTTKAMKMVSAAKLRRATEAILAQRPYAAEIARLMGSLSSGAATASEDAAKKPASLLVVISSDRGLCGGYNSSAIRAASQFLQDNAQKGRQTKCVFVGKKAYEIVKNRFTLDLVHYEEVGAKVTFSKAALLAKKLEPLFECGEVDEVVVVYNHFVNAISQVVKTERVLPAAVESQESSAGMTLFVPNQKDLYQAVYKKYFTVQLFKSLLDAQASEHGARMSAMENATKNAGDMIRKLTLQYNKQRQAAITKELLEIIAGSESQKA